MRVLFQAGPEPFAESSKKNVRYLLCPPAADFWGPARVPLHLRARSPVAMFVKPVGLGRTQARMMLLCVGVVQGASNKGQGSHPVHPVHFTHIPIRPDAQSFPAPLFWISSRLNSKYRAIVKASTQLEHFNRFRICFCTLDSRY